jgi:hypothetical protein
MAVRLSDLCAGSPELQEGSWSSCLLDAESVPGRNTSTENFNYLMGNGTRELPACSIVSQPATLPRAPVENLAITIHLMSKGQRSLVVTFINLLGRLPMERQDILEKEFKWTWCPIYRGTNDDTDRYLVVAKVRERLSVCKQALQNFYMGRFDLQKVRAVKVKNSIRLISGARCSVVFKALCYKPEGRGFDTRWGKFLNLPNPSGRTRSSGLLSL